MKWRLGAWDVQGVPLEAGQPAPGLSSTPIAGNPRNPGMSPYIRHPGTHHTDEQWKNREGRGEASQLGERGRKLARSVQPYD